jgi:GAF domain-containing protein
MNRQIAIRDSSDRVSLLYRLSHTFNSSLNLDEVLNRVVDEMITATRAEIGFMVLRQEDGRLVYPVARNIDRTNIEAPQSQVTLEVVEKIIKGGKPVLISDKKVPDRSIDRRKMDKFGSSSIMCAPLKVRENNIGMVCVENRKGADAFSEEDMELIDAISASAAIAIDNARLYQEAVDKGRMEHELQVARKVQRDFIPRTCYANL